MLKRIAMAVLLAGMLSIGESTAQPADDAVPNETVCAQGTYSLPCPKVIWCPADKCEVTVAQPVGLSTSIF